MRRSLKYVVFVMLFSLVAAACGDGDGTADPTGDATSTEAGAQTLTIFVDGEVGDSNSAILGYLPRAVTAKPGDTVDFAFQPGDPHTVTFGTLVDQAFAEMAAGDEPATMAQIPPAFDPATLSIVATGALPCFAAEAPALDGAPCEGEQTAFTGADAFYNSGLLSADEGQVSFTVEIAADAVPGTYNFFCLLHGPDMSGSVTVVGADEASDTAADVDAARAAELAAIVEAATPVLEAQVTGVQPGFEDLFGQGPGQVLAGGAVEEPVFVDILQFGPSETSIAAGETVTFNIFGFHTVSFNVPQDATPAIIPGDDGLPVFNPLATAPQGGAAGAPPPPEGDGEQPTAEPAPMVIPLDGGTFDGTGFFSSGLLPSFPPALFAWTVTFTTAGTYPFACLVHPGMEGTVTVT